MSKYLRENNSQAKVSVAFHKPSPSVSRRLKEEPRSAPKKERRDREDRQRERRRRERPQTIQSHSIFEQGPADTFRKTGEEIISHQNPLSVDTQ